MRLTTRNPTTDLAQDLVDTSKLGDKRRRACKPKVRTGCITCKKRRVKCDEAKPSCRRCEVAGWECDGYTIPVREWAPPGSSAIQKRSSTPARAASSFLSGELARSGARSATKATSPATAAAITTLLWPTIQRFIPVDPGATELERRAFQAFQLATEAGLVLHVCDVSSFWSRLAPQLGRQYAAVQHALLALGSAYRLHKRGSRPSSSSSSSSSHASSSRLITDSNTAGSSSGRRSPPPSAADAAEEIFMIKEYNKAIAQLREYASEPTPESISVALVCCLVFICLENLRFNHRGAIAHLANGIHIIESSVADEYIDGPNPIVSTSPSSSTRSASSSLPSPVTSPASSRAATPTPPLPPVPQLPRLLRPGNPTRGLITDADLRSICMYFRSAELGTHLFSRSIDPVLAYRILNRSRSSAIPPTTIHPDESNLSSLEDVHRARTRLESDVIARDWEVQPHRADRSFWRRPDVAREQEALRSRAFLLSERVRLFASHDPRAPVFGTPEYASLCLDMLHIKSMQCLTEMQRYRGHGGDGVHDDEDDDEDADGDTDDDDGAAGEQRQQQDGNSASSGPAGTAGAGTPKQKKKAAYWLTDFEEVLMREMVMFGEESTRARQACRTGPNAHLLKASPATAEFAVDMGVVPPMYFSYVYTANAETQERALRVLQNTREREGPWDTQTMLSIMRTVRTLRSSEAFVPVVKKEFVEADDGDGDREDENDSDEERRERRERRERKNKEKKVQSPWGAMLEHYEILSELAPPPPSPTEAGTMVMGIGAASGVMTATAGGVGHGMGGGVVVVGAAV